VNGFRKRPGPPKQFPHDLHIRLTTEEWEAIHESAMDYEISKSDLVRQCVRITLEMDNEPEESQPQ
jgi:hypothetical protein